jgi:hypothetical protein
VKFTDARGTACRLLHLEELTVWSVLEGAAQVLGETRVEAALDFARRDRLTRRHSTLAGIAALTVGIEALGLTWFEQPLSHPYTDEWLPFEDDLEGDPGTRVTADDILLGRVQLRPRPWFEPVASLAALLADDVAGPAVDFVDLDGLGGLPDIPVPKEATLGHRIPVAFDAGGRLDAVLVDVDGHLRWRLDRDSVRHSPPAEVSWAVGCCWQGQVLLLPEELPGSSTDPKSALLPPELLEQAEFLHSWARDHGLVQASADAWVTVGQVADAWQTAGYPIPRLTAPAEQSHSWQRAVAGLIDGRPDEVANHIAFLRP